MPQKKNRARYTKHSKHWLVDMWVFRFHYTIKYYYLFLQKLRNLKYRLKIQNELLRKLLLTSFKTTLHLHFSGIIHTCIQQGVNLCLHRSYTIHVLEYQARAFTPPPETTRIKISNSMTSYYYTHCFSSHKKIELLSLAEIPRIQRGTLELFCFSHVLT